MNAPGTAVAAPELVELVPANIPERAVSVEAEVARAREQAEAIEVDGPESAAAAVELSKEINRQKKAIEEERVSLTKPRKDAAEEIKARYDEMKSPFDAADEIIRGKLGTYQAAEEAKRVEAQRLIDEERERVEAEARAKREAAEQAEREAEELRKQETDAENAKAAEELAAEARAEAEKAGVVEGAVQAMPASAPVAAPSLKGFSQPKRWQIKSIDPDFLPGKYLIPDVARIKDEMRAGVRESKKPPEIPGVEFEQVAGSAVRT